MSYSAAISRENPTCFLFLIDQSGSMSDPMAGVKGTRKADTVADTINRLLQKLIVRATKKPPVPWDYFEVGVIGYGAGVGPAFSGALAGRELCTISEIYNSPADVVERTRKVSDGAGDVVDQTVKFPIWFKPVADNGTPMLDALRTAHGILSPWVVRHPSAFPPIVINITDGEADGDLVGAAQDLKALSTGNGEVLVFNCHISARESAPIFFPCNDGMLPDQYARQLYEMSSELPESLLTAARATGVALDDRARGFAFNADVVELVQFLNIGTQHTTAVR